LNTVSSHHWKRVPGNVARGMAIGTVEIIPGVSGGTVALVVGVYERLINSAGHVISALRLLVTDVTRGSGTARARAEARRVEWPLVAAVLAGMVLALLTAARVLPPLIEGHPVGVRALFLGMVAASVAVPILALGGLRGLGEWALVAGAAVLAWFLTGLPPAETGRPPYWLVAIAAAFAICALVLPGLSGSFLLLVLGLYEPTLEALDQRNYAYIGAFMIGAVVGLGLFVKLLQWLLAYHRRLLLPVLAGLMIGAMRALWPWQDADRALLAPDAEAPAMIPLVLLGAALVIGLILLERRLADRTATEPLPMVRSGPA
jgi:putative membrane protein